MNRPKREARFALAARSGGPDSARRCGEMRTELFDFINARITRDDTDTARQQTAVLGHFTLDQKLLRD